MKKKISLRLFLAVMWQGIKQVLCAIVSIFNYKNKTPFWRVIWAALTLCVLLITGMIGWEFCKDLTRRRLPYISEYTCLELSSHIYFYYPGSEEMGYTFHDCTGEHLAEGISWVVLSPGDSLAVFAKDRKRGYLNIYTGKEVIPPTYNRAWIFSDGVASVMQNDSIYFIDHSGQRIIPRGFRYVQGADGYLFHNGYCVIREGDKKGIIDKQGTLLLPFDYDEIYLEEHNYWTVCKEGRWGVLNDSLQTLFPCEYKRADVSKENGIFLSMEDNSCRRYSYSGQLLDRFVTTDVDKLLYDSKTYDKDGDLIYLPSLCLRYEVPVGRVGLMSKEGRKITDPVFKSIEAVDADLFLCHYEDSYGETGEGVLLNSRGEIVNRY